MCEAPRVGRSIFSPQIACVMTALTLAGVNGIERKRTPVASNTALAIAEGMTAGLPLTDEAEPPAEAEEQPANNRLVKQHRRRRTADGHDDLSRSGEN